MRQHSVAYTVLCKPSLVLADGRAGMHSPTDCAVRFMDTRDVLVVTPTRDGASVDLQEDASNARMDAWFERHGAHRIVVATGFIAKNTQVECNSRT
jgi:aspartokinase